MTPPLSPIALRISPIAPSALVSRRSISWSSTRGTENYFLVRLHPLPLNRCPDIRHSMVRFVAFQIVSLGILVGFVQCDPSAFSDTANTSVGLFGVYL
jgi:hypothetical protein